MGLDAELKRSLDAFRKKGQYTFPVIVKSVDKSKRTVTVTDLEDFEYTDVRLTAVIDESKAVVIYPKLGSTVLVSMIGNELEQLFVSSVREVESIDAVIENTEFHIDASGHRIKRGNEDLLSVLNDLIDELNKIVVIQGTSVNVPATTLIKQRLNTILKT